MSTGLGLAIAVAIRNRQLSRPSFKFHVGLLFEKRVLPRSLRHNPKRTLFLVAAYRTRSK